MAKQQVIALGFFDGVHKGHQQILGTARDLAREKGIASAAMTFRSHPRAFVLGIAPDMITSFQQRCILIRQQGIGDIIALPFDRRMAETEPKDFAAMLREKYGCVAVVCGENFRFGKNAAGTPAVLEAAGLDVTVCPSVRDEDGSVISSTAVRRLVRAGDMDKAQRFLGRPFFIDGAIVGGLQLGRRLGFPTINTQLEAGALLPRHGVYATRVIIDGQRFPAVTNVGTRPTVSEADIVSVESHLLGFSDNVYGEYSQVEFTKFLRSERAFDNVEELQAQIAQDVMEASKY